MSKIYVTNKSGHNIEPALQFGDDIIYLTEGKVNIFRTDDLIEDLKEKLKDFNSEDYLIFTGNSIVSGLALSILFTKLPAIHLLLFNAKSIEYVSRLVENTRLNLKEAK